MNKCPICQNTLNVEDDGKAYCPMCKWKGLSVNEEPFISTIKRIQDTGSAELHMSHDNIATINSTGNSASSISTGSTRTCPKCGNTVIVHLGANISCPYCGYAENDLLYRGDVITPLITDPNLPQYQPLHSPVIDDKPEYNFGNTGWVCPKCGRGLSPFTSVCPCYHESVGYPNITCSSQADFNQENAELTDNIINNKNRIN